MDSWHVVLLHLSHAGELAAFWHLVQLDGPGHCHARTKVGESNLDELLRVQGSVVISALTDRSWQDHASGVNRLPYILAIHAASYLLDKNWSQPFGAQLLVHAEEVDLCHLDHFVENLNVRRDSSDEADKLATTFDTNAQMPVPQVLWWLQSPPQEVRGVVKAKHAVIIFHVVLRQKGIHLQDLSLRIHIARAPLKLGRQKIWLRTHLIGRLCDVKRPCILVILSAHRRNRLGVPESMLSCAGSARFLAGTSLPQHLQQLGLGVGGLRLTLLAIVCLRARVTSVLLAGLLLLLFLLARLSVRVSRASVLRSVLLLFS
mmetsp:Transcript_52921/g.124249  ORF Transcript_52921/g.124249 Transcript_52921/m.124249 type:complete len:317 (-) Transcript_52921:275-1225(-)